ncbi:MAG: Glycosyl transferase family 2 [Candidatus Gottesmanbacteria bacterium GW2011_GWC2_39_8]|uniref:Glycosyl transferase family 2 n=1 Tax=Candidatus Gottesmanbacteria bacterium GW2011_GWC2_39_8 TaxID=1618450 RepID=A0A0G0QAD1_9BACT|nr:MAG: Glycosyl transferase family 2 [Candidatus Gottesmanbacteria bacterium GW2011_GWC2_39_8]
MSTNKFPKISVITPTYNQVDYIERTIRSVLEQEYPNLEYIIVDGASRDGTLDIIKDYKDKVILISEKDKGHSDAINKGLKRATGEIICYLNSDDLLEKGSLFEVARIFSSDKNIKWLSGRCRIINTDDREIRQGIRNYKNFWLSHYNYWILKILNFISQPATFWRKEAVEETFDEELYYTMDYDFWLRIGQKYRPYISDKYFASFRIQPKSKSVLGFQKQFTEEYQVLKRYSRSKIILFLHRLHYYLFIHGPYTALTLISR